MKTVEQEDRERQKRVEKFKKECEVLHKKFLTLTPEKQESIRKKIFGT